jgi:hypothetical protein
LRDEGRDGGRRALESPCVVRWCTRGRQMAISNLPAPDLEMRAYKSEASQHCWQWHRARLFSFWHDRIACPYPNRISTHQSNHTHGYKVQVPRNPEPQSASLPPLDQSMRNSLLFTAYSLGHLGGSIRFDCASSKESLFSSPR